MNKKEGENQTMKSEFFRMLGPSGVEGRPDSQGLLDVFALGPLIENSVSWTWATRGIPHPRRNQKGVSFEGSRDSQGLLEFVP